MSLLVCLICKILGLLNTLGMYKGEKKMTMNFISANTFRSKKDDKEFGKLQASGETAEGGFILDAFVSPDIARSCADLIYGQLIDVQTIAINGRTQVLSVKAG